MLKTKYVLPVIAALALSSAGAALPPGSNLAPYEIKNTASNETYCQMCAYSSKPATVAAYGKLGDAAFWTDLEKLQTLQKDHPTVGFYAQVLDSTDAKAIQAEVKKHGISFPVVYAVEKDWEDTYKVGGVSRTVYLSKNFKVSWSNVGLDEKSVAAIQEKLGKAS